MDALKDAWGHFDEEVEEVSIALFKVQEQSIVASQVINNDHVIRDYYNDQFFSPLSEVESPTLKLQKIEGSPQIELTLQKMESSPMKQETIEASPPKIRLQQIQQVDLTESPAM